MTSLGISAGSGSSVGVAYEVKTALENGSLKPPLLPEIAVRLTQIANKPNIEVSEIEDAVRRDPAVAAKVLSAANSAFHSRSIAIESLRTAIMHIGLMNVRDIAFLVVAQGKLFRVPGYDVRMRQLATSGHSVGLIAKKICEMLGVPPDVAYLCGLLHDVGEALLLAYVAERCRVLRKPLPEMPELEDLVANDHARAGAQACGLWKLPRAIGDAVLFHHEPMMSQLKPNHALINAAAEQVEGETGLREWDLMPTPQDDGYARQLLLSKAQVAELRAYAASLAVRETEPPQEPARAPPRAGPTASASRPNSSLPPRRPLR